MRALDSADAGALAGDALLSRLHVAVYAREVYGPAVSDPGAATDEPDDRWSVSAELLVSVLTDVDPSGGPRALRLRGCRIVGQLDLRSCFAQMPVELIGCDLEEILDLTDACVPRIKLLGCTTKAIRASGLRTEGGVSFRGSRITSIDLANSSIGGQLEFDETSLAGSDGRALRADRMSVSGDVLCRGRFVTHGEMRLVGAVIAGQLDLTRARLTNPGGRALTADGLAVGGDAFLRDGFHADGEVRLIGSTITGQLDITGAVIANAGGHALSADRVTVRGGLACRDGFAAYGEVRLPGARIGGQLDLTGAALRHDRGIALNGELLTADALLLRPRDVRGAINLGGARVRYLVDDPPRLIPRCTLAGFEYERFAIPGTVAQRVTWIKDATDSYEPGPYDQLVACYRRMGCEEEARQAAIAKQRHRRSHMPLPALLWSWALDASIGYGHRTHRALIGLVLLFLVGWPVFEQADRRATAIGVPKFEPIIYSLDVLLPIVDLGQHGSYAVDGGARWFAWVSILAGWLLVTTAVASLSGLLNRGA